MSRPGGAPARGGGSRVPPPVNPLPEKWKFSKEELKASPSFRDSVHPKTEKGYRLAAMQLIRKAGNSLLASNRKHNEAAVKTIGTAMIYWRSMKPNGLYQGMVFACLFLAAKVGEIREAFDLNRTAKLYLLIVKGVEPADINAKSEEFQSVKEDVVKWERKLLTTLEFDLEVGHPYTYVRRIDALGGGQKVSLSAKKLMKDSYSTQLPLRFSAFEIAAGCCLLAFHTEKVPLPMVDNPNKKVYKFQRVFPVQWPVLLDIAKELLEYVQPNEPEETIKAALNDILAAAKRGAAAAAKASSAAADAPKSGSGSGAAPTPDAGATAPKPGAGTPLASSAAGASPASPPPATLTASASAPPRVNAAPPAVNSAPAPPLAGAGADVRVPDADSRGPDAKRARLE